MKIDKKERIRKFINMQYVKIKRTAAVGSLIILTLNLSLTIYPFISHRGMHPYLAIPIIFTSVIIIMWIAADIYVKRLEMYRTEFLAERILNPYTVYAIGPFEEMKYRSMEIPTSSPTLTALSYKVEIIALRCTDSALSIINLISSGLRTPLGKSLPKPA